MFHNIFYYFLLINWANCISFYYFILPLSFDMFLFFILLFSLEEEEDTSNEILYGSLMCISLDKKFDRLIWATVVKCYPRLHAQSNPNSNIK